MSAVFVCDDICPDTCCCCGGSASLGGTQEPIPGSARTLRYCSLECHDEWEDHLATRAEMLVCCPQCGYDQGEHDPGCAAAPALLVEPLTDDESEQR